MIVIYFSSSRVSQQQQQQQQPFSLSPRDPSEQTCSGTGPSHSACRTFDAPLRPAGLITLAGAMRARSCRVSHSLLLLPPPFAFFGVRLIPVRSRLLFSYPQISSWKNMGLWLLLCPSRAETQIPSLELWGSLSWRCCTCNRSSSRTPPCIPRRSRRERVHPPLPSRRAPGRTWCGWCGSTRWWERTAGGASRRAVQIRQERTGGDDAVQKNATHYFYKFS